MGFWTNKEKGYGSYKQSKSQAKDYITAPGTRMGVDTAAGQIGDKYTTSMDAMARDIAGRIAPTVQPASYSVQAPYSANLPTARQALGPGADLQSELVSRMRGMAFNPQASSVVENQYRQGMDDAIRSQVARAAAAGGPGGALALREAMRDAGAMRSAAAGNAAALRLQEQQGAQAAISNLATQMTGQNLQANMGLAELGQTGTLQARGQDIGQQQFMSELQQNADVQNLTAALQQTGLNDQMVQFFMAQGFTRDQAEQQARVQIENIAAQNYATAMGSHRQETQGMGGQLLGAGISAGGTVLGGMATGGTGLFSDRRLKTDVKAEAKKVDEMIRKLKPYSYEYVKGKGLPEGRQIGVMAQDLERSELGKTFVVETPKGKAIDTVRGYGAVLAALRRIDERLGKVEGKAA